MVSSKTFSRLYTITIIEKKDKKKVKLRTGDNWVEKECTNNKKGTTCTVKIYDRNKLCEEDKAAIKEEVDILKELDHPNIIKLFDYFEEREKYYLTMERMKGGELFNRITEKVTYSEKSACKIFKNILDAIKHCHEHNIAHRDLKPENILLSSKENDTTIKITNFNFAAYAHASQQLTTQCGTQGYVAPEILNGQSYGTKVDMWSLGVILYILLGGYQPFIEDDQKKLFKRIKKGDYEYHEEWWVDVSVDAKQCISSLLTVDPSKRLSAKKALSNKWIKNGVKKPPSKSPSSKKKK